MTAAKAKFNNSAVNAADYVFSYADEAKALYQFFPDQKDKLYFVDGTKKTVVGLNSDEEAIALKKLNSNEAVMERVKQEKIDGGSARAVSTEEFNVVILWAIEEGKPINFEMISMTRDQNMALSFDHEVGHLIAADGIGAYNLSECIADCYAAIRHYQRFGNDSKGLDCLLYTRAVDLFKDNADNGDHFTAPAIEAIMKDAGRIDFKSLSHDDTLTVARRYARNYALHPHLLQVYLAKQNSLRGLTGIAIRDQAYKPLQDFFTYLNETEMPEVLKWGTVAFRGMVEARIASFNRIWPPAGGGWKEMLAVLDQRNVKLGHEGDIFFGIETASKLPTRRLKPQVINKIK